MKIFKDMKDREWKISLTLGSAMEVRDRLDVDLLQPEEGDTPLITRIGTDERLLAEIILCLISDQFESANITEKDVLKSFDGDTILAAQRAFYEELESFFQARGRRDRATAVRRQLELIEKGVAAIESRIDALDLDAEIDRQMKDLGPGETIGRS